MSDTNSPNNSKWFPDIPVNNMSKWYQNKDLTIRKYVENMLSRTAQMFVYQNLPKSMPPQIMETWLQQYGQLCIARIPSTDFISWGVETVNTDSLIPINPIPDPDTDVAQIIEHADEPTANLTGSASETSDIYFFTCEPGGKPDIYYRPTICVVANPRFKEQKNFVIGKNCVLMKNDVFAQGLLPIMFRYAKEYTEADITIISTFLNTRIRTIIEASDGPEIESARQYLADIEAGRMSAITSRPLIDSLKIWSDSIGTASLLTQTIDARQALQVAWFNELGIDPNFSLKREYVSAEEIGSNTDLLMPLVDHMLVCRKNAVDQINKLFGTNILVEKSSAWAHKAKMAQTNAIALLQDESGGNNVSDDASDGNDDGENSA